MKDFKKRKAWQKAFVTARICVKEFSKRSNKQGFQDVLSTQLLKSSISIPSNIVEGCGRKTTKEQMRFFEIALGSAFELETQLK